MVDDALDERGDRARGEVLHVAARDREARDAVGGDLRVTDRAGGDLEVGESLHEAGVEGDRSVHAGQVVDLGDGLGGGVAASAGGLLVVAAGGGAQCKSSGGEECCGGAEVHGLSGVL